MDRKRKRSRETPRDLQERTRLPSLPEKLSDLRTCQRSRGPGLPMFQRPKELGVPPRSPLPNSKGKPLSSIPWISEDLPLPLKSGIEFREWEEEPDNISMVLSTPISLDGTSIYVSKPWEVDKADMALANRSRQRTQISEMKGNTPVPHSSFRENSFKVGQMVEVRCIEEDCDGGAWYKAIINKILKKPQQDEDKYVVELESLKQETIEVSNIRPRQTRFTQNDRYSVDDLIEVYHEDGWRPAIVLVASTNEPPSKTSCYTVWLPSRREQAEFEDSQMRPRLEYKDKKWIPYTVEGARFDEGEYVRVAIYNSWIDDIVLYNGRVLKIIDRSIFLVEYESPHKLTEILHERFLSEETMKHNSNMIDKERKRNIERFAIQERDVILKMDMLETERTNKFRMCNWLHELDKVIAKEGNKRDDDQREKDAVDIEMRNIQFEIYELENKLQEVKENLSHARDSFSEIESAQRLNGNGADGIEHMQ